MAQPMAPKSLHRAGFEIVRGKRDGLCPRIALAVIETHDRMRLIPQRAKAMMRGNDVLEKYAALVYADNKGSAAPNFRIGIILGFAVSEVYHAVLDFVWDPHGSATWRFLLSAPASTARLAALHTLRHEDMAQTRALLGGPLLAFVKWVSMSPPINQNKPWWSLSFSIHRSGGWRSQYENVARRRTVPCIARALGTFDREVCGGPGYAGAMERARRSEPTTRHRRTRRFYRRVVNYAVVP